jgi:hypothetical protein
MNLMISPHHGLCPEPRPRADIEPTIVEIENEVGMEADAPQRWHAKAPPALRALQGTSGRA